jgi:hypothetical protein
MAGSAAIMPVRFERPIDRDDELRSVATVRFLDLPTRRCVMIDGEGPPDPAVFATRMPGLYTTAWSLRFALKRRGTMTRVGPLEGLWWTTDGTTDLDAIFGPDRTTGRETWRWTLFIALPNEASDADLDEALARGRAKLDPALAPGLRVERFAEGRVAQVLHLGPYATERATIERLHAAIEAAGLRPRGRHHEIYLGIPGKGAPERLKTILRQPFA